MNQKQDNKYVLIAHNHVAVKAPGYLYKAVAKLLEGTPIATTAEDNFHATVFYSKTPLNTFTPDPTKEFEVTITGARIWYDPYLGCTNLIIDLISPELEKRHEMIKEKCGGVSVYPKYEPHLTLVYDMPAFTHTRKSFLNAFTDYVQTYLTGEKIALTGEYLESTSGVSKALGI
jgi:hypothetical protein